MTNLCVIQLRPAYSSEMCSGWPEASTRRSSRVMPAAKGSGKHSAFFLPVSWAGSSPRWVRNPSLANTTVVSASLM